MKSMKTGLLAAAMVLLPGVAQADRPDWSRHGGGDARPAPQAPQPPAAAPAPAPPPAGSVNGGGHNGSGGSHGQWQGRRFDGNPAGPGHGNWGRPDARPIPPQAMGGQQQWQGRGNWPHDANGWHGAPNPPQGGRDGDHHWNGGGQHDDPGDHRWNGGDHRWDGSRDHHDGAWDRDPHRWNDDNHHWDNGRRWSNDHRWDGNHGWSGHGGGWDAGRWRNDHRYDWRGWRNGHRDLFRGHYYAPRGYAYRPLYRGFTLDAFFYGSNYWLSDPYEYRLPPVEWPLRWVRYYNDAVLVDVTSGEVVDVIQNFFW